MSNTEAEVVADLARQSASISAIKTDDGRQYLMVPNGFAAKDVTDPHGLLPRKPAYIQQNVTVQALDSLIAYVNDFKRASTRLFADIDANSITALIDYHGANGSAENVAHAVTMKLPYSEEWKLWTDADGKLIDQLSFARFLEENHPDVAQPNAAELIEAARDLHAARNVRFTKVVRTDSDNESFSIDDQTTLGSRSTGQMVELPRQFTLRIPVYFGESAIDITAFLRWKLDDGGMKLGIKIWRREHIRQAEFRRIVTAAGEATTLTPLFGAAR